MNPNRRLAELLGIPWHGSHIGDMNCPITNPDFADDPRLVLREMGRLGHLSEIINYVLNSYKFTHLPNSTDCCLVIADYLLDTSGKLRDAAIEFLERREK